MIFSLHFTGLGGQGVVTMAKLLASYTEAQGFKTTIFTSKGMAQRGGRVTTDVRVADSAAADFSPRNSAAGAHILIGMEVGEALNSKDILKKEGSLLLYERRVVPSSIIMDKKASYPTVEEVKSLFSRRVTRLLGVPEVDEAANIYVLGVLCAQLPSAGSFFTIDPQLFAGEFFRAKHNMGV